MQCRLPLTLHDEALLMLGLELFMWLHASFPWNLLHVKVGSPLSPSSHLGSGGGAAAVGNAAAAVLTSAFQGFAGNLDKSRHRTVT